MLRLLKKAIRIGSRVRYRRCKGDRRHGTVMAIATPYCRVEWDDGNSDLVKVTALMRIAGKAKGNK